MSRAGGGTNQLALPLAWPADESNRDFIVTPANAAAVRHLDHPALWPVMATILTGPRKSGRSLLGRLFAIKTGGELIDDAEAKPEEAIFHAWNRAQASRRPLLIVADARPPVWAVSLPDLSSRLAATPAVRIEEPDDALLTALMAKQLATRCIATTPEMLRWLARRIDRSYVGVARAIDVIDQAMLGERKPLTMALLRRLFT